MSVPRQGNGSWWNLSKGAKILCWYPHQSYKISFFSNSYILRATCPLSTCCICCIIPVFKTGDHAAISNYHPISLLCIFSKVFEKIIFKETTQFVSKSFTPTFYSVALLCNIYCYLWMNFLTDVWCRFLKSLWLCVSLQVTVKTKIIRNHWKTV